MSEFVMGAKLTLDNQFSAGMSEAAASTNQFRNSASGAGSTIAKAFGGTAKAAVKGLTVAISAAATFVGGLDMKAISIGSDFEAGMSVVKATAGASADDMVLLTAKAKEMGATTAYTATEATDAMNFMAQAGWTTQEMLGGMDGVLNLAAASGESLGGTCSIVTDSLTAFGMAASEAGHFADVLALASAATNTDVALMGETFKYVAPVAGALGYSCEDMAAAIGLMANSGIKGSQAGTALRATLSRLAKPTKETTKAMKKLGISLTNKDGSMKSFNEVMTDMREGFSGLNDKQKATYAAMLGGQEAMSGLLAIVTASDEDFYGLAESIANCEGVAKEMADTRLDNFKGQVTILKSALEGLAIEVYDALAEPLKEAAVLGQEYVGDLTDAFKKGGFNGLIQGAGSVIGKLITKVVGMAPQAVKAGVGLISTLLSTIKSNAGTIGKGAASIVGALTTGIVGLLPELVLTGIDIITSLMSGMAQELPSMIRSGTFALAGFARGLATRLPDLIDSGLKMLDSIIEGITNNLPTIITAGIQIITTLAVGLVKAIPQLIAKLPEIVRAIWDGLTQVDWIGLGKELLTGISEGLGDIGSSLKDLFTEGWEAIKGIDWNDVGTTIQNGVTEVGTFLSGKFQEGVDLVKGLDWAGISSTAQEALGTVGTWISGKFSEGLELAKGLDWAGIGSAAETAFNNVGTWLNSKVDEGIALINATDWSSVGTNITNGITDVGQWLADKFIAGKAQIDAVDWASVGDSFRTGVRDIGAALWEGVGDIGTWFSTKFGEVDWAGIGANLLEGFQNGFTSIGETVKASIVGYFESVWNAVKAFFGIASPSTEAASIGGFILEGFVNGFSTAIEGAIAAVTGFFTRIWDAIKGVFGFGGGESEESKQARQAGSDITNGITEGISSVSGEAEATANKTAQAILDAFKSVLGVTEGASTITKGFGANLAAGLNQGLSEITSESFVGGASGVKAAVETALQSAFGNVTTNMGFGATGSEAFKPIGANIVQGIVWGVEDNKSLINQALQTVSEDTVTTALIEVDPPSLDTFTAAIQTAMSSATTEITNWESSTNTSIGAIGAGFSSLASSISSSLKSVSLYSSGVAIMQGLNRGLNSMRSTLLTTARSIADSIRTTINDALKIASPSKVTTESGAFTSEGLVVGMLSKGREVREAAETVAGNAAEPFTATSTPASAVEATASPRSARSAAGGLLVKIEQLILQAANPEDPKQFAQELMKHLYELLREADHIMGGDMEVLL